MESDGKTTVLMIIGMRDNACRERLLEALRRVSGVREIRVSLMRARATIVHQPPCEAAELVWTVVSAGFGAAMEPGDDRELGERTRGG
jgi:copper chaperone CopZ